MSSPDASKKPSAQATWYKLEFDDGKVLTVKGCLPSGDSLVAIGRLEANDLIADDARLSGMHGVCVCK